MIKSSILGVLHTDILEMLERISILVGVRRATIKALYATVAPTDRVFSWKDRGMLKSGRVFRC